MGFGFTVKGIGLRARVMGFNINQMLRSTLARLIKKAGGLGGRSPPHL